MKVEWTAKASNDLARLHAFLASVAPAAAANVVQLLVAAPQRLIGFPRLGSVLEEFMPREVRRLIVGKYEMRYEVFGERLIILRIWHGREERK